MVAKRHKDGAEGLHPVRRPLDLSTAQLQVLLSGKPAWRPSSTSLSAAMKKAALEALELLTNEVFTTDPAVFKSWLGNTFLLGEKAIQVLDEALTPTQPIERDRLDQIEAYDERIEDLLFGDDDLQQKVMGGMFPIPELQAAQKLPTYKDDVTTLLRNAIELALDERFQAGSRRASAAHPEPVPSASWASLGPPPPPSRLQSSIQIPFQPRKMPLPSTGAQGIGPLADEQSAAVATGAFSAGDFQAMDALQGKGPKPPRKPRVPGADPLPVPPSQMEMIDRQAQFAREEVILSRSMVVYYCSRAHIAFSSFQREQGRAQDREEAERRLDARQLREREDRREERREERQEDAQREERSRHARNADWQQLLTHGMQIAMAGFQAYAASTK